MARKVEWHDDWLSANCMTYESYKKLTDDYNELFDEHLSKSAIKNHCHYKLGMEKPRQNIRHYTEEQREWLAENLPKYGRKEACRMFNEKFGETRTVRAMKSFASNYGTHVNEDVWKRMATENVNKNKLREVGSIRIDHGRPMVKVGGEARWQFLNRVTYEKEHGKIPQGYCIMHLDNNPMNCDIDNLVAVERSVLMTMTGANLKSEFPEVTKVAITWCRLKQALERSNNGIKLIRNQLADSEL